MDTNVTLRTCRICQTTKYATYKTFAVTRIGGMAYWSKDCLECKKKKARSKFKPLNGKIKQRHKTEHTEKVKAYARDKKCLAPWCSIRILERLEFDHALANPLEKPPADIDWNDYRLGTMKCSHDHKLVKTDKDWYFFGQIYLAKQHPEFAHILKPRLPDELIESIWEKFIGMTEYVREPQLYLMYRGKIDPNQETL